jgi:hypothetical protein
MKIVDLNTCKKRFNCYVCGKFVYGPVNSNVYGHMECTFLKMRIKLSDGSFSKLQDISRMYRGIQGVKTGNLGLLVVNEDT